MKISLTKRFTKSSKKIVLISGVAILTSCSTMLNGSYQTLQFKSSTQNAKVMVNTREIGVTNTPIKVKRSDLDGLYRISQEGCKTKEMELELKTANAYWGTALLGMTPIFGQLIVAIDLDAQNHLKPINAEISVELDCIKK
jgi:hypothetical protein